VSRGRWFTIDQAGDAFPAVGARMFRRLVQERRLAFSRVGRRILISETDIEALLEANRTEPLQLRTVPVPRRAG
jgi:excisionase family DNA binding protein